MASPSRSRLSRLLLGNRKLQRSRLEHRDANVCGDHDTAAIAAEQLRTRHSANSSFTSSSSGSAGVARLDSRIPRRLGRIEAAGAWNFPVQAPCSPPGWLSAPSITAPIPRLKHTGSSGALHQTVQGVAPPAPDPRRACPSPRSLRRAVDGTTSPPMSVTVTNAERARSRSLAFDLANRNSPIRRLLALAAARAARSSAFSPARNRALSTRRFVRDASPLQEWHGTPNGEPRGNGREITRRALLRSILRRARMRREVVLAGEAARLARSCGVNERVRPSTLLLYADTRIRAGRCRFVTDCTRRSSSHVRRAGKFW